MRAGNCSHTRQPTPCYDWCRHDIGPRSRASWALPAAPVVFGWCGAVTHVVVRAGINYMRGRPLTQSLWGPKCLLYLSFLCRRCSTARIRFVLLGHLISVVAAPICAILRLSRPARCVAASASAARVIMASAQGALAHRDRTRDLQIRTPARSCVFAFFSCLRSRSFLRVRGC